jgi:hypothetical protein
MQYPLTKKQNGPYPILYKVRYASRVATQYAVRSICIQKKLSPFLLCLQPSCIF